MVERRVSVRVTVEGRQAERELGQIGRKAAEADVAVRAIPNEVKVRGDTSGLSKIERDARRANQSTSALADSVTILAPAFTTVSAAAVPALAGLSTEFGITAAAVGVGVLAFNHMSDALKALDEARIDPSAANLQKLDEVMSKLSPSARAFAEELDGLRPQIAQLSSVAGEGIFPGLSAGIDSLQTRLPEIEAFVSAVGQALGQIGAETGQALAGDEWDGFFNDLIRVGKPVLVDTAHTVGDLAAGVARLWQATLPLTTDFTSGLADAAKDFHDWADAVEETHGANEFMDYVRETGPVVVQTLGKIGNALLQVAEAAAPIGGPTLKILGDVADVIAHIADSPAGTVLIATAVGLAAVNRALAISALAKNSFAAQLLMGQSLPNGGRGAGAIDRISTGLSTMSTRARQTGKDVGTLFDRYSKGGADSVREVERVSAAQGRLKAGAIGVGKGAAAIGAITLATTGLGDSVGITNTAMFALAGSAIPGVGTAAGAAVGSLLDLKAAGEGTADVLNDVHQAAASGDYDRLAESVKRLAAQNKDLNDISGVGDAFSDTSRKLGSLFNGNNFINDSAELFIGRVNLGLLDLKRNTSAAETDTVLLGQGLRLTASGAAAAAEGTAAFDRGLVSLNNALAVQSSLTSYKGAILAVGDALKKNGATLDLNTAKGVANQQALDNLASQAQSRAKNLIDAGNLPGGLAFLDRARKQYIDLEVELGKTRTQAKQAADALFDLGAIQATPSADLEGDADQRTARLKVALAALDRLNAKPKVKADTAGAMAEVRRLVQYINSLHPTVRIRTTTGSTAPGAVPNQPGVPGSARGNYFPRVRYNAGGDFANAHRAEMAGPGVTRVWREPETMGESYIPHANDSRRPRAEAILNQTAGLFGGRVIYSAGGSFLPGKDQADYDLQLLQQQQTINQINADLAAKIKKGKHKGQLELSGFARQVKLAELKSAQLALQELQAQGVGNNLDVAAQAAQDAADAATAAADALTQAISGSQSNLFGQVSVFSAGTNPARAVTDINKEISLIAQYGKVMASLQASGAQPALLAQVRAYAEQGDLKGAIRFGNALLAQPLLIGDLNNSLGLLDTVSTQVAGFTNGAGFSFTPGSTTTNQNLTITLAADPSAWLAQVEQYVQHYVPQVVYQALGR